MWMVAAALKLEDDCFLAGKLKNTGVGCHFLLQEIFPTQGSNPGLPHHRQTLYCLSHQEVTRCRAAFLGVTNAPGSRWPTPSGLQPLPRSLWPPWDLLVMHQPNPYSHWFTRELAPAGIQKQHAEDREGSCRRNQDLSVIPGCPATGPQPH